MLSKTSNSLEQIHIFVCFDSVSLLSPLYVPVAFSLSRSVLKSDGERFSQVAHDKRAMGGICSISQVNRSFALLITKNEGFAQKTDERIPNPA